MKRRTISKPHDGPPVVPKSRCNLPFRAQRILLPIVFGAMAAACIPLGVLPVVDCIRAMRSSAMLATAYPRDAVTIPLCLAFSLFAAMCSLPDTQIRLRPSKRSSTARQADRFATVLFAGAGISMLIVPFAVPLASIGLAWLATDRGYVACPSPAWNRYGVKRWALEAHACPGGP